MTRKHTRQFLDRLIVDSLDSTILKISKKSKPILQHQQGRDEQQQQHPRRSTPWRIGPLLPLVPSIQDRDTMGGGIIGGTTTRTRVGTVRHDERQQATNKGIRAKQKPLLLGRR
jgi:hypothetical protein